MIYDYADNVSGTAPLFRSCNDNVLDSSHEYPVHSFGQFLSLGGRSIISLTLGWDLA